MKAEIIAVGTEILTGQIVNTNAQFLSEKFAQVGIDVYYQTAVGDNAERLSSVLKVAQLRSDVIVLCGGLGPTEDDLTKQTLASFLGRDLVYDGAAMARLDAFFKTRPDSLRTPNNDHQAQIIKGSIPLQNTTGLAVGGLLVDRGITYVVLPGPPSELQPMVRDALLPQLATGQQGLYSRVLRFFGIGESQLVTVLADLITRQTNPTIAPYAKPGEVTLRLSTKASSQSEADGLLDGLEEKILCHQTVSGEPLSHFLYGYGDEHSLAAEVLSLLKSRNLTVTAAESLTAGLFQATLADLPGASAVFEAGFVTYSLQQKAQLLEIPQSDLVRHGVVSAWTAEQMALQARRIVGSDLGVSLTGVAGPDTLEGQAVGTVFIGLANERSSKAYLVNIGGRSRRDIRQIAVLHAFNLIRLALLNDNHLI